MRQGEILARTSGSGLLRIGGVVARSYMDKNAGSGEEM
jgi:hypothetical protein